MSFGKIAVEHIFLELVSGGKHEGRGGGRKKGRNGEERGAEMKNEERGR